MKKIVACGEFSVITAVSAADSPTITRDSIPDICDAAATVKTACTASSESDAVAIFIADFTRQAGLR